MNETKYRNNTSYFFIPFRFTSPARFNDIVGDIAKSGVRNNLWEDPNGEKHKYLLKYVSDNIFGSKAENDIEKGCKAMFAMLETNK